MMKMNFKYVSMMAAALVMGMSSCSNDNDPVPEGPQGEKNAKLSVTLVDGNSPVTYAAPSGSTVNATNEEKNILDGNVYIFDENSLLEALVAHNALTGIQLTPGTKTVYFVGNTGNNTNINPTPPVVGTTTIADLLAEKATIADIEELTEQTAKPTGNFYLSNVKAAGTVTMASGVTSNLTLNIGRGVAKIVVEMSATAIQPSTGTLANVKYMIRNNPVETFLIPRYVGTQVQVPLYNDNTPANYFDNGTVTVGGTSNAPTITITDLKDADGDEANNYSYAVENAHATPLMGNSTYALIEGVFTPNATVNGSGVATPYNSGDDFFRIQYVEEMPLPSTDVVDRGFYSKFFSVEPNAGDSEYQAADAAKPASAHGGTVSVQVVKYLGGKCYYYLYIGDPNGADDVAKRTVERNQYYYMTINSVSDCGLGTPNPTAPGVEPSTNAYLNVGLQTVPWGVVGGAGGINSGI